VDQHVTSRTANEPRTEGATPLRALNDGANAPIWAGRDERDQGSGNAYYQQSGDEHGLSPHAVPNYPTRASNGGQ
jgi:hypothetical protein